MKYFTDAAGAIYGYEDDGTQDHLIDAAMTPLSAEDLATRLAPSPDVIQAQLTAAIQAHLDATARQYRYDSIHTACGWAGEFADATALKMWAAECWRVAGAIESEVAGGLRQAPTADELIGSLPGFVIQE